jgi:citrate lyase subunit alpha/citrate CoA-transferase
MPKNSAGRELPLEINGEKLIPFKGAFESYPRKNEKARERLYYLSSPKNRNKVLSSINEALDKVGLEDGKTISFHHHLRDGDYLMNLVLDACMKKGIKNLTLAPSSTFPCQEVQILRCIEEGVITHIEGGSLRDKLGEFCSKSGFKKPIHIRSHGGRVRAIEAGDFHIDAAFIGASCTDESGNCNGVLGKSACGCISYSVPDSIYADKVVVITDNLVQYPASPIEISEEKVDWVVKVDKIGDPGRIVSGTMRITKSPTRLKIARDAVRLADICGYVRDGMVFQTGAGGISLAFTKFLGEVLRKRNIKASLAIGGTTELIVSLFNEGLIEKLFTVQAFDISAIKSIRESREHQIISGGHYANIHSKGCAVNSLDVVVLGATEVDVNFNVNTITLSDGVIANPIGGHQDTSAGAKLTLITIPLLRNRLPMILDRVTTVTTPGETVDAVITEYGIAINPKREDLIEKVKGHTNLKIVNIEDLKNLGYKLAGIKEQKKPKFGDRIVALVEYRDGTILDVIREVE